MVRIHANDFNIGLFNYICWKFRPSFAHRPALENNVLIVYGLSSTGVSLLEEHGGVKKSMVLISIVRWTDGDCDTLPLHWSLAADPRTTAQNQFCVASILTAFLEEEEVPIGRRRGFQDRTIRVTAAAACVQKRKMVLQTQEQARELQMARADAWKCDVSISQKTFSQQNKT